MKRLLSLILSLVMLTTMVFSGAFATTVAAGADDGFNDGAFDWDEVDKVADYGYDALAAHPQKAKMQFLYNQLKNGIEKCESEISLDYQSQTVTEAEVAVALDAYIRDYAEHFWLGNEYSLVSSGDTVVAVRPTYLFDASGLVDAKAAFDTAVETALAGVQDNWSEYQKALYLHDYLAGRITYQKTTHAHNAYGALVNGAAVCEGYAEAYQVLLREAGIQSFIAIGSSVNPTTGVLEPHAWNYVKINNRFCHVDLTWDDPGVTLYHAYFGVTDAMIGEDHTIGTAGFALPECTTEAYFYFSGKNTLLSTYDVASVAALLKNNAEPHVYITGDVEAFIQWYFSQDTVLGIAKANGVTGKISVGYSQLGREFVLKFGHKHEYDNGCDATCNSCGATRQVAGHVYDNSLDATCNECGATRGVVTLLGISGSACVDSGKKMELVVNATGDGLTYEWYFKNKGSATFTKTGTFTDKYYTIDSMNNSRVGRQVYCVVKDTYGNKVQTETFTLTLHTYDNGCDANCNICDAARQVGDHQSNAPVCKDGVCVTCGKDMPATKEHESNTFACQDGQCVTCGKTMIRTAMCISNAPDCQNGQCITCGGPTVALTTCHSTATYACEDGVCFSCGKPMPSDTGCVSDAKYACQDGNCIHCGKDMPAITGCVSDADYACQDGNCTYCGKAMAAEATCRSNATAICQDGNCIYCEKVMPAETTCKGVYAYPCQAGHCEYCMTQMAPTAAHGYDNDCDADCNVCGAIREVTHDYKNEKSDKDFHWNECDCGAVDSKEPHSYNQHKHNDTEHWNECACGQEEADSRYGHTLTITFDGDCHWLDCPCGYAEAKSPHAFEKIENNKTHHWGVCTCGKTAAAEEHVYGDDNLCDVCDHQRVVLAIIAESGEQEVQKGATAEIILDVLGEGLTYQWYYKGGSMKSFALTKTFTDNRYFVAMDATRTGRQVYCVVTDKYGNKVTSRTYTLRMTATITKQPTTGFAKQNVAAKVSVTAVGDGLTYQWYVKNPGTTEYVVSSVKTATYSAKMTAANSGRLIYCVITDKYGHSVQTKTVVMRMQATIVTQPKTVTVKNGTTAKTTVKAVGDGLTYTWYVKNKGAKSFGKSSIKTNTYSVKMSSTTNGRQVYCVVKDKYGKTVTSSTVTLKKK